MCVNAVQAEQPKPVDGERNAAHNEALLAVLRLYAHKNS